MRSVPKKGCPLGLVRNEINSLEAWALLDWVVSEEACLSRHLHYRQVGESLHIDRPEVEQNSRMMIREVRVEEVHQDDETSDGSDVRDGGESGDYLGDGDVEHYDDDDDDAQGVLVNAEGAVGVSYRQPYLPVTKS
jgi:hypothetical protein